jgi:hypothetical protein
MAMGMPYGLQAMLKEGHKHFSGVEEAVMKNIEACKALAQMTKTSLGPNGAYVRSQAILSAAVPVNSRQDRAWQHSCSVSGSCTSTNCHLSAAYVKLQ